MGIPFALSFKAVHPHKRRFKMKKVLAPLVAAIAILSFSSFALAAEVTPVPVTLPAAATKAAEIKKDVKATSEQAQSDAKAAKEKATAEKNAAREKARAEKKAAREKARADKKALREKVAAEKKAAADKAKADAQAVKDAVVPVTK